MRLQLKDRLNETQKKVDASKAEVTRLSNELSPVEVPLLAGKLLININ